MAQPDVRSIFAQAIRHHQAGRLDAAIACYHQALALMPDLAGAHHNLGTALCELGKWQDAEASFRRALAFQPGLASAHNNLGTVLQERDRLDEAMSSYRQALVLDPGYAEALNNLGGALCRQGKLDEGEACIRQALALKPDFAGAHDNLGAVLWEQGRLEEAEASTRRAVALAPGLIRAWNNLGAMLRDQGRLEEALGAYQKLLQLKPGDADGLNGMASVLAARGDLGKALETILHALHNGETASAARTFVDIVKRARWTKDNAPARAMLARALTEPWARPGELARTAANLIKQSARLGPCIARAAQSWPQPLPASELFGEAGAGPWADDALLLALLVSAQNTDVELERFFTLARRLLLQAAAQGDADDGALEFHAALARQCFINDYVFARDDGEVRQASALRDRLAASLESRVPIPVLPLLAVAAYFPLHSLPGAERLMDRTWPEPVRAVLVQQVREPLEEARLRVTMPKLTPVRDKVSRAVRDQYEENPYPRWVRRPAAPKTSTIAGYLRQKFPFAAFARGGGDEIVDFLSAGCGTGQLALEIAQSVKARVLAVDLSLASLAYVKRKARELALDAIEFAQADLLELGTSGRSFDVVECSGVLHHLADPFAGWRKLLSLVRPGGFMVIGLYSEAARRGLVEARRYIAERGYGASADDIRRCRQDLLEGKRTRELCAGFGDFFGVSVCRDLLFHVQEQQMRLPAIASFLKDNGLTFVGFETDSATLQAYRRRFPEDPAATDLARWDAFERDNPDIFSDMYVFWLQRGPHN